MRIQQSLCLPCFYRPTDDIRAFCREVRALGYRAVEIHARSSYPNWETLFETARSEGLAIASMCGHESLGNGLNQAENHDRIEAELHTAIGIARQFGLPGLICFSGNRNPRQSDCEGLEVCAQGLQRIARFAEENGINLNMELLNSRVDHPGYQCDRTEWGVALCRRVSSPRVKLLFDIYHMQIMEGDLIRTIRAHIRHIGHFHTAGNPGRRLMDDTQELHYAGICRAIAGTEYAHYVGHEFGFGLTGNRLPELQTAFTLCDQA